MGPASRRVRAVAFAAGAARMPWRRLSCPIRCRVPGRSWWRSGPGVNPVDLGDRSDAGWSSVETRTSSGTSSRAPWRTSRRADRPHRRRPVGAAPSARDPLGSYAERIAVDVAFIAPRPAGLELVEAATLPLAGGTGLQSRPLGLPDGSWLLVHGAAGGVGHLMVQLAAIRGLQSAAVSGAADRRRLLGLGAELWVDRAGPGSPAADAATRLGHDLDAAVDLVGGQLVRRRPTSVTAGTRHRRRPRGRLR